MPSDYPQVPATAKLTTIPARVSTPPPILRRGSKIRRRKDSLNPLEEEAIVTHQLIVPGEIKQELLDDDDVVPLIGSPVTYSTTPIKQLPFSPSQFLNSPNLTFDVQLASSSTPVRHNVQPMTPQKERTRPVRDRSYAKQYICKYSKLPGFHLKSS